MKLWLIFPPNMKAGKAELLRKHGKRFCYVDPHTQTKDRNHEVRLFPDEATEVENQLAKKLLKQDPHLVSEHQQNDFEPATPGVMEKREQDIRDYNSPVMFKPNVNPNVSKPGHPEGFNTIDQAHEQIEAEKKLQEPASSNGNEADIDKFLKPFTDAVADDDLKLTTFQAAADTDFGPIRTAGVAKILNVFGYQPKNPKTPVANLKLALNGVLDVYAKTITHETGDLKPEQPAPPVITSAEAAELPITENPDATQAVVG